MQVIELQTTHRLLTLTGPGGIGKTSLALVATHRLLDRYPDGVRLVDLATLTDPDLVLPAIAAVLDLRRLSLPLLPDQVAAALASRQLLLVLDNCEHVIEQVARVAEAILYAAPHVRLLVTSQEPLRADGECVYRVTPLAVPGDEIVDADIQLRHGAVRLFIARARLADARMQIDDELATTISGICRRLDGIPLAIELAAARAALLGVHGVAAGLDDRFRLLTGGRRTALKRHQTLRATLDWSFDLLSEAERGMLCRLGAFAGSFTLEAAQAIMPSSARLPDTADCIASLVDRSLVSIESIERTTRYRLLETMRLYALERLAPDETQDVRRRHLRFYGERMRRAEIEWQTARNDDWLAAYRGDIDNVRAALQWSLASGDAAADDIALGVTLAAASMPLWLESSLHTECRQWAERALAAAGSHDARQDMVLQVARGGVLLSTGGDSEQAEAALQSGLAAADALGDREYALRALYSLWVHFLHENDYTAALAYAERFRAAAKQSGDAADAWIGDRLVGTSQYYLARQDAARSSLEGLLRTLPRAAQRLRESRFGLDQEVATLSVMARVLALQGELDRAMSMAEEAVDAARRLDRIASFCHALGERCVVALWIGNAEGLADAAALLMHQMTRYGLCFWRAHTLVAQGVLAAKDGAEEQARSLFDATIDEVGIRRFDLLYPSLTGVLAEGLAAAGRPVRALALINQALGRSATMQRWYAPEFLVVRGDLMLASGVPGSETSAEADFVQALQHARRQPALLLELRAVTGLARLEARRGHPSRGLALLDGVYSRFSEGLHTTHLRAARDLLGTPAGRESKQVG